MSVSNENNRPMAGMRVGAINGTEERALIHAHKMLVVKEVCVVDIEAVPVDGVNYLEMQVMLNGVPVGNVVSTAAGISARQEISMDTQGDISMVAGDLLSVMYTKVGSGALTNASMYADVQVKSS